MLVLWQKWRGSNFFPPVCSGEASRQMTLDDIATKINSEAALLSQKWFWPSAVLRKANQDAEDFLAVVLDKPFSNK